MKAYDCCKAVCEDVRKWIDWNIPERIADPYNSALVGIASAAPRRVTATAAA